MPTHLQAAHPNHWNCDSGTGVNIPERMSQDMQIGHNELVAIGICPKNTIFDSTLATPELQLEPTLRPTVTIPSSTQIESRPKPQPRKRKADAIPLEAAMTKKPREN
jgi:hypothetical protein